MDLFSYSIVSGILVSLIIVKSKISIVGTINIHILMNLTIKMINLIDVIPYMTVMTDIS